jgi:hypothetical protein
VDRKTRRTLLRWANRPCVGPRQPSTILPPAMPERQLRGLVEEMHHSRSHRKVSSRRMNHLEMGIPSMPGSLAPTVSTASLSNVGLMLGVATELLEATRRPRALRVMIADDDNAVNSKLFTAHCTKKVRLSEGWSFLIRH